MFISKEKYAAALQQISDLESAMQEKDLQIQQLEDQLKEKNENPDEHTRALDEMKSQIQQLTTSVEKTTQEKADLQKQLEDKDFIIQKQNNTIDDLNAAVEKLNNSPADQGATAISNSDADGNHNDLDSFIVQNQHDTLACVRRLKEAGY